ncbi:V-type proton ATPase subunit S1 [Thalassophryne amazonica]|uniref:V-type proton ATPase subunit S1 n=1 Tax=Thalassophryne amazonica TaxID=390379 RepID=UPI0014722F4C|nr:V-type proton ATPase subunit S1 [Thalassophryne amazonica]
MATSQMLRRCSSYFAAFILFLDILNTGNCDAQVPLVLWTSSGMSLPDQSPPTAGHIVGQQQLSSYLEKALNVGPRNVLLFLQDKMSIEDFTMYGGAFGNKQDSVFPNLEGVLMSSPSPLVLPAVSWPASNVVIGQLQDHLETSPLYMDPETLSQLRLNASSPSLLVFRLPYGNGADLMSAKEILSGNDEVIGQVLSIMKTQSVPYTAIYTALRPSREAASLSLEAGLGGARSLLQTRGGYWEREKEREKQRKIKERAGIYAPVEYKEEGETACILMWAKSLSVSILRSGRWEDHDLTLSTFGEGVSPKLHGSSCDKSKSRLALNYENVLGHRSFKLIFAMSQRHYKVSARRWFTLDAVELEYDGTKATFNGSRNIYAPAEYSYHCESVTSFRWPLLVPRSLKDPANQWRVSFEDFQIQAFNVTEGEFSYASDCAGFFTPGIWMGLMTSLLMVLVLTYGLHMIMQLHTMDRFDDPKGPAISVPQTE